MKKNYLVLFLLALFFANAKAQTVITPANEVFLPQFAYYGGTASARVHYVCRLKLTGLNPSSTYIYATGMSSDGTKTGQTPGYMILIKNSILGMSSFKAINASEIADGEINYGPTSRNGRFDTNSSGEYEGWFSCVPVGTAGQQDLNANVYFYIQLNNGAGGTANVGTYRTTNTIKLLDYTAAASGGTALIGTSTVAAEKMVFLYDNTAFTGRPLAGTWTEDDGFVQASSGSANDWTTWYSSVDATSGKWGTMIPNDLSTGVRGIKFLNLDKTDVSIGNGTPNTSTDGVWNSVSTVNLTGGTTAVTINSIAPTTLPITLTNFSAQANETGVKLNWQTAQEINNQYFELQRSTDGKVFTTITKLNGAGNTNDSKYYTYTDYAPQKGTNYYQLKQVDSDGKSTVSNVISADFGLTQQGIKLLSVSGNEISISISLPTAQSGSITYTGLDGRILYQKDVSLSEGLNTINIPVSQNFGKAAIITFSSPNGQQYLKIAR